MRSSISLKIAYFWLRVRIGRPMILWYDFTVFHNLLFLNIFRKRLIWWVMWYFLFDRNFRMVGILRMVFFLFLVIDFSHIITHFLPVLHNQVVLFVFYENCPWVCVVSTFFTNFCHFFSALINIIAFVSDAFLAFALPDAFFTLIDLLSGTPLLMSFI